MMLSLSSWRWTWTGRCGGGVSNQDRIRRKEAMNHELQAASALTDSVRSKLWQAPYVCFLLGVFQAKCGSALPVFPLLRSLEQGLYTSCPEEKAGPLFCGLECGGHGMGNRRSPHKGCKQCNNMAMLKLGLLGRTLVLVGIDAGECHPLVTIKNNFLGLERQLRG